MCLLLELCDPLVIRVVIVWGDVERAAVILATETHLK